MSNLNEREMEALNCIVRVWQDADSPLPGGLCYQDVLDLLEKLGADKPTKLLDTLEYYESLSKANQ